MKVNDKLQYRGVIPFENRLHSSYDMNYEEFNKFITYSFKIFQAHNLCKRFLQNICQLKAVAKGWRPRISPGYYRHVPLPLSKESRGIRTKRNSQMFNSLPPNCRYRTREIEIVVKVQLLQSSFGVQMNAFYCRNSLKSSQ